MRASQAHTERSSAQTGTSADNRCRWDGRSTGHYEVWYLTLSDRVQQTGAWIRYTVEAPLVGPVRPELWFAHFDARKPGRNVAVRKLFAPEAFAATDQPFSVDIGGNVLGHDFARGQLDGGGQQVAWNLRWQPAPATHRQLPPVFYRSLRGREGLSDTTVLTPNLDVAIEGWIEVGGRRLELFGEPGGQTHLWGRKHAHAWAWGHCNAFDNRPGAALETLTARLEKRGRILPPLTVMTLYLDGEALSWNQLHRVPLARGSFGTGFYRFSASSPTVRLEGEYRCRPEDMIQAEYEDPDGTPSYCCNTEVADLDVTVYRRSRPFGKWLQDARLTAPRGGHFEVGSRERDPAIGKGHQRI